MPIRFLVPVGLRAELLDLYTSKPEYNVSTGGRFQHKVALSGGIVCIFEALSCQLAIITTPPHVSALPG